MYTICSITKINYNINRKLNKNFMTAVDKMENVSKKIETKKTKLINRIRRSNKFNVR